MGNEFSDLDASIQEKIDADVDFQMTLTDLSEEDKTNSLAEKKAELLNESIASLNEKAKKAEEIARNQEIRARKAEAGLKAKGEVKDKENPSLLDIRALNKVHDDDVERVEKFAKAEGVSIAEALKNDDLLAILNHRAELRKTAEATNTGGSKRGSQSPTPEQIVEAGMSGKEVDPVKFAEAQMALRQKRKT